MIIPIDEQIRCVERELSMRAHVYPRRVADHRMTQKKADEETAAMQAVLETLHQVQTKERLI